MRQLLEGEKIEIDLPRGAVWILEPGIYDVDAGGGDQPERIAVFEGSARFIGGTLDVRSGRVALVSSAADWEDVGKVAANPRRAAPKRRHPADDALLLDCAAGPHQLLYTFLEQSEFGLQTWLLA